MTESRKNCNTVKIKINKPCYRQTSGHFNLFLFKKIHQFLVTATKTCGLNFNKLFSISKAFYLIDSKSREKSTQNLKVDN